MDEKDTKRSKNSSSFKKSKTEISLDIKKSARRGSALEKDTPCLSKIGKQKTHGQIGAQRLSSVATHESDSSYRPDSQSEKTKMLTNDGKPKIRPFTRQESTLSRGFKQTKQLVRRRTEILVHGVEAEKEEDHHKNWTMRRMQTRGRIVSWAMGNINKEKLEEKCKTSGWSKIRHATEVANRFKRMGGNPLGPSEFSPGPDLGLLGVQDPIALGRAPGRDMSREPEMDDHRSNIPRINRHTTQTSLGVKNLMSPPSGLFLRVPSRSEYSETNAGIPPGNLNKESVATMGWKALRAKINGVSVMNSLITKDRDVDEDVWLPDEPKPPAIEMEMDKFEVGLQICVEKPAEAIEEPVHKRRKLGRLVSQVFNRQEKRYPGLGFVQRCMGRARKSRVDSKVKLQLDNWQDHRPFFTWWVSTVQVLVLIFALAFNGFETFGLESQPHQKTVQYRFTEINIVLAGETNFYFGPSKEVLVRLGAKYTPCMRRDKQIYEIIECERKLESYTACCVNAVNSCLQLSFEECSSTYYYYVSYENIKKDDPKLYQEYYENRTRGTVCGLDPEYCDNSHEIWPTGKPQLDEKNNWYDDITKWPVCSYTQSDMKKNYKEQNLPFNPALHCQIIARPCCIGNEGKCMIVHQQYCEAHGGTFHQDKALCSQVDCLESMCGMLPFISKDSPNQLYRLWLSLFLHAGILHLCLSIFFQMIVLRDLEKLAGWWRIGLIYVLSGVVGNLSSAIFVPYRADVGPSGACFGLIACLFVEFIQSWQLLDQPWYALAKLAVIAIFLFLFGLLPWVDNYAHLFGFISGILLSFALLPYIVFGEFDLGRKFYQAIIAILIWLAMTIVLFVVLYHPDPVYLEGALMFTCVPPFGEPEDFCKTHKHEPVRSAEFWAHRNKSTCLAS